jgi:hypothetical protein
MTIQNAPPGLDYDRDKKFSKVIMFFLAKVENEICTLLFSGCSLSMSFF